MKPQSAKAKGKRLEHKVAEMMRTTFDKYAKRMPLSGAIEWMKGDIYNTRGLNIECKNQEKVKLWEWWQIIREKQNPRLIISGNNRPVLVVMPIEDWLELEQIKVNYYDQSKSKQSLAGPNSHPG